VIEGILSIEEYPCSDDRYCGIIDDTDEAEEENKIKFIEMMEELNNNIEQFLHNIDAQHKTKYAPTGKQRMIQ
jgi:hypothetical protein